MRSLLFALLLLSGVAAGESGLTVTYQPLNGLGAGGIKIAEVTCCDWHAMSGMATQIGLISARNVPPTNNPEKCTADLNLASACGLRFESSDIGDPRAALSLTLDATKFGVPTHVGQPREDIIRASLECLRRCLPEKLQKTPVTLKCQDSDREWLLKIVSDFNSHDRSKVFFPSTT
jgi:hypothetical protein